MSFQFFNPTKHITVTHGHLPHWDQEGATYFITWRTADSIPKQVWEQWKQERAVWLHAHGIDPSLKDWRKHLEELSDDERSDFRRFSAMLEQELDAGHGECVLRRGDLACIVADSMRHFDGVRYTLGDFVIMPNHVHLLVGGLARDAMLKQVASWKKWTAIQINDRLGQKGRFWQDEHFDHLVRGEAAFRKFRRYIAENPFKARLRDGEFVLWQRPEPST